MPQTTAALLIEQYEAAVTDAEALALHIAQENWDTPEQLQLISELRVRYERLAEELRTAIAVFR